MSEEAEVKAPEEERRLVAIVVKPKAGVEPLALYEKIRTTILSTEEFKLKWEETCKINHGNIFASFTIELAADFHEEVIDEVEMLEDEVASIEITFQAAME
jgi:hypothetical protein